jgi:hypothetical protein
VQAIAPYHSAVCKAKVALTAFKGEQTVVEIEVGSVRVDRASYR